MAQNDRPGGLIALAVINFIFCAFDGIAVLGTLMLLVALQVGESMTVGNPGTTTTTTTTVETPSHPNGLSVTSPTTGAEITISTTDATQSAVSSTASDTSDGDESGFHSQHSHVGHANGRQHLLDPKQSQQARSQLMVSLITSLLCASLLLISGIGYIRQKKVQGRFLGTAYGVVALLGMVAGHFAEGHQAQSAGLHHALGIWTLITMIYPVLTIIVLNTVFRDDLAG
jgi:hypothetical protein